MSAEPATVLTVSDIGDLTERVRQFADARDWQQFHTPKNLAMALAGEVGELLAEMQWLTDAEIADQIAGDPEFRARLEDEIADVMVYLVRLSAVVGVDLAQVAGEKIGRNEARYPVETSHGTATKHSRLAESDSKDA